MEYPAGNVAEYVEGDRRLVECGDKQVGVFFVGGEFFAWHNRCGHLGGPVCQGRIMNRVLEPMAEDRSVRAMEYDEAEPHIVCPWHGYEFSIRTGRHPANARIGLRKAEIVIRDGGVYVVV